MINIIVSIKVTFPDGFSPSVGPLCVSLVHISLHLCGYRTMGVDEGGGEVSCGGGVKKKKKKKKKNEEEEEEEVEEEQEEEEEEWIICRKTNPIRGFLFSRPHSFWCFGLPFGKGSLVVVVVVIVVAVHRAYYATIKYDCLLITHTHTHTYARTYARAEMRARSHVCTHTHTNTNTRARAQTHIDTHVRVHIHTGNRGKHSRPDIFLPPPLRD